MSGSDPVDNIVEQVLEADRELGILPTDAELASRCLPPTPKRIRIMNLERICYTQERKNIDMEQNARTSQDLLRMEVDSLKEKLEMKDGLLKQSLDTSSALSAATVTLSAALSAALSLSP